MLLFHTMACEHKKNKNDKDEFIKKGLVHKRLILIVKGRNNMRNATVGVTSGCTT